MERDSSAGITVLLKSGPPIPDINHDTSIKGRPSGEAAFL